MRATAARCRLSLHNTARKEIRQLQRRWLAVRFATV